MELRTIGIDLGKTVFHLVGLNLHGEVVVRKKCSRKQLLHFTANLKVRLIGMEACGGSHFLGRALREQGHEVRLIPAQYVKPYVKTNKSDYIDAEAIAEAVGRPRMRFVAIKSDDQLDTQSLHRVRERWVMRRTAVINQVRGSPPGSGWSRENIPPGVSKNCSGLANAGTPICESFSCMGSCRPATERKAIFRPERLVGPTHSTHPP
jgi:hypothetical protein